MIPLARRPATTVVGFQWPNGAASTRRSRLGLHPSRPPHARRAPAVEAGHRCGCGGLVHEAEALAIHVALPHPPAAPVPGHVGPILLGRSQALFLCDRSSRCSMSAMVDSAFTAMPRTASAALISRRVIPALLDTMARRASACFSSRGRR